MEDRALLYDERRCGADQTSASGQAGQGAIKVILEIIIIESIICGCNNLSMTFLQTIRETSCNMLSFMITYIWTTFAEDKRYG